MFLSYLARLREKQTYWRCAIDLIVVHVCMLTALPLTVLLNTIAGRDVAAGHLLQGFWPYYFSFFLPASVLFPAMFFILGLYDRSEPVRDRKRQLRTALDAGIAVFGFFIADYVVFHTAFSSRSLVFVFSALVILAVPFSRVAKTLVVRELEYEGELSVATARKHHVLVVGGAGYIGSILTRALLAKGYAVRVLDKLVYGDAPIRDLLDTGDFDLVTGDCRNIQSVSRAMTGMQSVVHLAAIVGDPACELDHQATLEINYAATRMLAEVAKGCGVQRFIFASSCSVYGATDEYVTETSPVSPISLYGRTKVDSEQALISATNDSFAPVILRFATVFGHSFRPRFDLVVNLLTAKAREEGIITIFNGEQWRPFIHVNDVVRALIAALEASNHVVGGQIYNVGDSRFNCTLAGIAEKVRAAFPATEIVRVENADRRNYRVCFDKIHQQLGFECRTTIEEGIAEMKRAFDLGIVRDYTDLNYHNQRYLSKSGSPANAQELDAQVMAAFSSTGGNTLTAHA